LAAVDLNESRIPQLPLLPKENPQQHMLPVLLLDPTGLALTTDAASCLYCAAWCCAGNGSFEHIGDEVPLPQAIPLKEGVFEVGRASPADIQIPIPTVSSRHALLRVGEWPGMGGQTHGWGAISAAGAFFMRSAGGALLCATRNRSLHCAYREEQQGLCALRVV
jgi:hypothetical protein